jgi:hypothetical protein
VVWWPSELGLASVVDGVPAGWLGAGRAPFGGADLASETLGDESVELLANDPPVVL